jgi:hypothetical protein
MSRWHVPIVALLLAAFGLGMAAYKSAAFGLPFTAQKEADVWTVEARAVVQSDGSVPVRLEMPVPDALPRFVRIQEDFISATFGVAVDKDAEQRRAIWTARRLNGESAIYYRIQLVERLEADRDTSRAPAYPEVPEYEEPYRAVILGLLDEVRRQSADIDSFARQLLRRYANPEGGDRIQLLRARAETPLEHVQNVGQILAGARIPSRVIWTLPLSDGMRAGQLEPWLQIHNGRGWITLHPGTGAVGLPADRVVWTVGEQPRLTAEGATVSPWTFAAAKTHRDLITVAKERAQDLGSSLLNFSLLELPLQTQNVYRILLTVPIGALLVVLLRNIIGVKTFGTFMPVLIAMAFRETQLLLGIALFSSVVALSLLVRFYLEKLRLLLVPRLAAVVTVVVLVMAMVSMASHQLGIDRALSIALFPIVILAMTVERISLVWEESGAWDALVQSTGSLAAAVLAYLVMIQPQLQYVLFVFPELLLVVLAVILLLGRYTGYRLTELWRFRSQLYAGEEG